MTTTMRRYTISVDHQRQQDLEAILGSPEALAELNLSSAPSQPKLVRILLDKAIHDAAERALEQDYREMYREELGAGRQQRRERLRRRREEAAARREHESEQ